MREAYAEKMKTLLSDKGTLAGVLFNKEFENQVLLSGVLKRNTEIYSAGIFT